MEAPLFKSMERRQLLSGAVLVAGDAALFDLDGDGFNDAILVNTGDAAGGLAMERPIDSSGEC